MVQKEWLLDILGMGKAIDLVRDILTPVGATASDVWAGVAGDRITFWRARNALKYQPLLHAEAARLGLKLNSAKIPDKFAFSWFEEATKQDEEDIQILFARLLARAADEESNGQADRRLVNVLAEFTPEDAELFQRLFSPRPFPGAHAYSEWGSIASVSERGYPADWLKGVLGAREKPGIELSLDNLTRAGCLSRIERYEVKRMGSLKIPSTGSRSATSVQVDIEKVLRDRAKTRIFYIATALGVSLYQAIKE